MPDLMTIDVPDISTARAGRVWSHVLATATREQIRTRRRRAVGTSAGATTLAGILGFAMLAPASSFASWTDVPTPVQVDLSDPSVAPCLRALPGDVSSRIGPSAAQPILGERRGLFTALLVASEGTISMCITSDDALFALGAAPRAPALRQSETLSVIGNAGMLDEGPRYLYGRVADGVRGVTVLTEDGVRVTASVRDGFFVAWWPTPGAPATVTATDESGALLASLTPSGG